MRRLLAALMALIALACGGVQMPSFKADGGRSSDRHCADLLASAYASPKADVAGSFDCLNPAMRQRAEAAGVHSDHDLSKLAQKEPVYTTARYAYHRADGGFVFGVDGPGNPPTSATLVIWITDGLVSRISII